MENKMDNIGQVNSQPNPTSQNWIHMNEFATCELINSDTKTYALFFKDTSGLHFRPFANAETRQAFIEARLNGYESVRTVPV